MSFTHTVLITGGTLGLGYQCALNVARQHPEYLVVLSSRTDPNSAATSINTSLAQKNVVFLPLDLSSLSKVRAFAETWRSKDFPPIISLLLNAGVQFPGAVSKTADGIEATFGINHVGHALLFHLLVPHMAEGSRVVITSSGTHDPAKKTKIMDAKYISAEELAYPSPESEKVNNGRQRYATSKLVNVLWMKALHRRLQSPPSLSSGSGSESVSAPKRKKMSVVAFDPGLMPGTGLARESGQFGQFVWSSVMPRIMPVLRLLLNTQNVHSPEVSGRNLARLAVSEEVEGESGVYFEGPRVIDSSKDSYNEGMQDELWEWTVKKTAINEEEQGRFRLVM